MSTESFSLLQPAPLPKLLSNAEKWPSSLSKRKCFSSSSALIDDFLSLFPVLKQNFSSSYIVLGISIKIRARERQTLMKGHISLVSLTTSFKRVETKIITVHKGFTGYSPENLINQDRPAPSIQINRGSLCFLCVAISWPKPKHPMAAQWIFLTDKSN